VIIAEFGGLAPNLTGPLRACSTDRIPFVSRREPRGANPQPTEANPTPTADPAALARQRIRERLELAAILAGCSHPEQTAAAQLAQGLGVEL
jgi:hypothetical protein